MHRVRRHLAGVLRFVPAIVSAAGLAQLAHAQGTTSFTYQGKLMDNGVPANGVYDIRVALFSSPIDATQVGSTSCFNNVTVVDGLFTITPQFGLSYDSTNRYLELSFRPDTGASCGNTSGFTTVWPRTMLTPTPFAVESFNARNLGSISAANYARTDINETFLGSVTILNTFNVLDNASILTALQSSNADGARMRFTSDSAARAWTIGATGASSVEGNDRFSIFDATSNRACLVVEGGGAGFVGIGTSNPIELLEVRDGRMRVTSSDAGFGSVVAEVTNNEHGLLGVINSAGFYYVYAGQSQLSNAANVGGQLLVCDINGSARGGFQINSANTCTMFAQVKSFMVDNPDDETTDIYYACIEGPEAAMYVRGTGQLIDGEAVVTLPRHFEAMALAEGITVQITPLSADCNGIAVVKKGPGSFAVKELMRGRSNAEFDWEVKAVRAGYEDFEVIRPKGILNPPKPEIRTQD